MASVESIHPIRKPLMKSEQCDCLWEAVKIKKTVKLGNFSQPPMNPPPPSKLGKNI